MTPSTISPVSLVMGYLGMRIHKQAQLAMPRLYFHIKTFTKLAERLFSGHIPPPPPLIDKYLGYQEKNPHLKSPLSPYCSPVLVEGKRKVVLRLSIHSISSPFTQESFRHGVSKSRFEGWRITITTFHKTPHVIHSLPPLFISHNHSPLSSCFFFPPAAPLPLIKSTKLSPFSSSPLSIRSASHPRPNFSLKTLNFPASSSSTLSSRWEDGFQRGLLRVSFIDLYSGAGEVVRWRNVEPSESVTSWVNVYGRLGRRRREAWRSCVWWWWGQGDVRIGFRKEWGRRTEERSNMLVFFRSLLDLVVQIDSEWGWDIMEIGCYG